MRSKLREAPIPPPFPPPGERGEDLSEAPSILLFGDFSLERRSLELRRGAQVVPLPKQPATLLLMLAVRAGQIVTREELQRELWPETPVGVDGAINACVRQVRSALGDEASEPRFIETLPRRGYRFIHEVEGTSLPVWSHRYLRSGAFRLGLPLAGGALVLTLGLLVASAALEVPESVVGLHRESLPEAPARLAYLQARYLLDGNRPDAKKRSIPLLERTLEMDPSFAPAQAELADCLFETGEWDRAREMARSAAELDPGSALAPYVLSRLHLIADWDLEGARKALDRAELLAPDHPRLAIAHASLKLLAGDREAALGEVEAALTRDPIGASVRLDSGSVLFWLGEYERAIGQCQMVFDLEPGFWWAQDCIVSSLIELGRYEEAVARVRDLLMGWEVQPESLGWAAASSGEERLRLYLAWRLGRREAARGDGEASPLDYKIAQLRTYLGDSAGALEALEAAAVGRDPAFPFARVDPWLARLRGEPRFERLVAPFRREAVATNVSTASRQ